ncbi:hypothetical protein BCR39DRAFT_555707 [Naematelia encephala]|uniref:Uncharacterized protein n=1 Tax=Naematelia encephala TaxID=71784 RepID=A0A1Y2BLL4_9TREE|nr:hypothetical protein BCR39DRAFT_555707 [Naematelia encephala]
MYDADPMKDPVWAPGKNQPFNVWLEMHKPSQLNPDDDQWISISNTAKIQTDSEGDEDLRNAADKAWKKVAILEKRMMAIQKNVHLPVRATRVGQKTKAVAEAEARDELIADLKRLAEESACTSGKWLVHPKASEVDSTWSVIARSVLSGPLRKVGVLYAKVGTTGDFDSGGKPACEIRIHVIDAWDACLVRQVMETFLVKHGICPTAVKADLYTAAGIARDNPCRLRSTIWRPDELTPGGAREIRRLSMQFAAKINPSPGSSSVYSPSRSSSSSMQDQVSQPSINTLPSGSQTRGRADFIAKVGVGATFTPADMSRKENPCCACNFKLQDPSATART